MSSFGEKGQDITQDASSLVGSNLLQEQLGLLRIRNATAANAN